MRAAGRYNGSNSPDWELWMMSLMGLVSGAVVIPMALWALSGHPETMFGLSADVFLVVAPVGIVVTVLVGAGAFAWLVVWAVAADRRRGLQEDGYWDGDWDE